MIFPITRLRPLLSLFVLLLLSGPVALYGREVDAKASLERLANDFHRHFLWPGHERHYAALDFPLIFPKQFALLEGRVTKVEMAEMSCKEVTGTILLQWLDADKPLTPGAQQENAYKFLWKGGRWYLVSGTYVKTSGEAMNAFALTPECSIGRRDGTPHYETALDEWVKMDAERMQKPEAAVAVAQSAAARAKAAAAGNFDDILAALGENLTANELAELLLCPYLGLNPMYEAALKGNAGRVLPAVAGILKDPRNHAGTEDDVPLSNGSLLLIGEMLSKAPHAAALRALLALWPVNDSRRRQCLIMALILTGAAEAIPVIEKALEIADDDEDIVPAFTRGLQTARSQGRKPGALEQAIAKRLPGIEHKPCHPAIERIRRFALEELEALVDPDSTLEKLETLSLDNPEDLDRINSLLSAVTKVGIKLTRKKILALLGDVEKPPHFGYYLLPMLGDYRHPDDKPVLEFCLQDKETGVSKAAATGLGRWHGLPDLNYSQFIKSGGCEPPAGLPAEVRNFIVADYFVHYISCGVICRMSCDGPVSIRTGGVAALEAVGLKELAALLKEGLELDAATVAARGDWDIETLTRIMDGFRDFAETSHVTLLHYRIKHADIFKKLKTAP